MTTLTQEPPREVPEAKPVAVEAKAQPVARKESKKASKKESNSASPLIQASFRLPQNVLAALIMAAAQRKMQRVKPSSQQDIITEAIESWLEKNGYSIDG